MTIQQEQALVCVACKEATKDNSCIATMLVSILFFFVGLALGAIFL